MSYVYVFLTIVLTVYGQLIIKWQAGIAGPLPEATAEKIGFLVNLLLTPWVISAFLAAFLASMTWIAAMTKLQISHAYPFMSLAFVLVLILSGILFHEPITSPKIAGMVLIVAGIIVGSQG